MYFLEWDPKNYSSGTLFDSKTVSPISRAISPATTSHRKKKRKKDFLLPALSKWVTAAFLSVKSFFRRFAKFCCGPLRILNVGSGYGQRRSENMTSEWAWGSARERQMLRFRSALGR